VPPDSLREQQLAFANHLRNPALHAAPPGVSERRLRVYRELFFNNISQLLAGAFPVIRSMLPDAGWQALVRDFYTQHRCETPLFPFIAGEFADYLQHGRDQAGDLPFLAELALYEWSEIALRHADEETLPAAVGDKPRLSPLCWPLAFRWPVHRIGADYQPVEPPAQPTCLLVYRDDAHAVRFIESNAATFRLLALLADDSLPHLAAVTAQLALELQHPDEGVLASQLQALIRELAGKGILLP
jgi:hypothetical protein